MSKDSGSQELVRKVPDPLSPLSGSGWQRRRSDHFARLCGRNDEPSLTEQHHMPSCDINEILKRYEKTGVLPRGSDGQFFFGDFSDVTDFQTAHVRVQEATAAFMQLPAKVRGQFDNDPHKLLQFIDDPKNLKEAVGFGLVDFKLLPKEVQAAIQPPPVPMGTPAPAVQPPATEPLAPVAPATSKSK